MHKRLLPLKNIESREALRARLINLVDNNPEFSLARGRVVRLENVLPVGYPVQFRVSGEDLWQVRAIAEKVADIMRANPYLVNVNLDWNERKGKSDSPED